MHFAQQKTTKVAINTEAVKEHICVATTLKTNVTVSTACSQLNDTTENKNKKHTKHN